jgi:membrane-associated phospholipid phosphatase
MAPDRSASPGVPALLGLAAAAAAGVAALYLVAVRTTVGQRIDDAARGNLGDAGWSRAREATSDLLDTISVTSLALLGAAIMAIALARGRPRLAIGAGVLVLGANVTTQVMKAGLSRPDLVSTPLAPQSYPSGHVTVAMSLAMALMLVAPPALRWPATLVGCAYAMGVGVAVIALDWHRPSDVVGAYLVCVAWTALVAAALAAAGRRELGASDRPPSRAARAAGAALVAAGAVVAAALAASASARLDLLRVADDRTAFVAAAVVCALACAGLCAAVALLVQRATSPPGAAAR